MRDLTNETTSIDELNLWSSESMDFSFELKANVYMCEICDSTDLRSIYCAIAVYNSPIHKKSLLSEV